MLNNSLNKYRKVTLLLVYVCILILLPSFLLLMASSWSGDDYLIAKSYQVDGLNGLSERIFAWSPRFFSEIILYLYYNAVPWLGKPFTGGMILIIWLFLISSIFIFTRNIIKNNSLLLQDKKNNLDKTKAKHKAENVYLQLLLPLLITLIFFTYLLYSQSPGTMFYLVVVAAAYVSTLAGIIFNLNFFINQSNSQSISLVNLLQLIIFGIITSCSWEMGAVYQLLFSSCLFSILLLNNFSAKFNHLPFSSLDKSNNCKLSIANFIPFCLSLYILYLLLSNRVGTVEANNFESPLTGNFKASLIAALLQFLKEFFFLNSPAWETHTDFYSFSYSVVYKLGFLLLLTILFYKAKLLLNKISINACILSIVFLLFTNFMITFSGYYQLGENSLARQTSFKSALIGLTIVLVSLILAFLFSSKHNKNRMLSQSNGKINIYSTLNSPITLLINFSLIITIIINLQLNNIKQDLNNFHRIIISNYQNWQKNLNSNELFAVYTGTPTSYIFRMYLEPGVYPSCEKSHNNNEGAARYASYFDKQQLYVIPLNSQEMSHQFDIISEERNNLKNPTYVKCPFTSFGNIEQINEFDENIIHLAKVMEVNSDETVEIVGWAINPNKSKAKRIIITAENDEILLINIPVKISRPDVAEYFNNPNLVDSGWKATFIPSPEWDGKTITFKVWTYDPDTKIANFSQKFILNFSSQKIILP